MKDISLGWPRFQPPSNRCYTDWYIPLCSAQSVGFIASSLLFSYVCVQIETKHGKQKNSRLVCSSVPFVPSTCFLGGRQRSKNCFVPMFLKIGVIWKEVYHSSGVNWTGLCVCELRIDVLGTFLACDSYQGSRCSCGFESRLPHFCDPPSLCGWTQHCAVLCPISKNKVKRY